jgi:hypothetical protein
LIKPRKPEKKYWKNRTVKKMIKSIKILKKPTGSFRFRFFYPETGKTEPNPNRKNRKKPSQTGLNQFRFFLIRFGYFFSLKIEPNRKWTPLHRTIVFLVKSFFFLLGWLLNKLYVYIFVLYYLSWMFRSLTLFYNWLELRNDFSF